MGDLGAYFGAVVLKFAAIAFVAGGATVLGGYLLAVWLAEHVTISVH